MKKEKKGVAAPINKTNENRSKSKNLKSSAGTENQWKFQPLSDIEVECVPQNDGNIDIKFYQDGHLVHSEKRNMKFWKSAKIRAELTNKVKEKLGDSYSKARLKSAIDDWCMTLSKDQNIEKKLSPDIVKEIKKHTEHVTIYPASEGTVFTIEFKFPKDEFEIELTQDEINVGPKPFQAKWLGKKFDKIHLERFMWEDLCKFWLKGNVQRDIEEVEEISEVNVLSEGLISIIKNETQIYDERETLLTNPYAVYYDSSHDAVVVNNQLLKKYIIGEGKNFGFLSQISKYLRKIGMMKKTSRDVTIKGELVRVWSFKASKLNISEDSVLDFEGQDEGIRKFQQFDDADFGFGDGEEIRKEWKNANE